VDVFTWSQVYETGIDAIDAEHVNTVNLLFEAMTAGIPRSSTRGSGSFTITRRRTSPEKRPPWRRPASRT
jgi:hypothetical protein